MGKWAESFTLYDLFGYFAVGALTILGLDVVLHWEQWPDTKLLCELRNLNIYFALMVAIPPYVLGQLVGSASRWFYDRFPGVKRLPHTRLGPHVDWALLGSKVLENYGHDFEEYGRGNAEAAREPVYWLCHAFFRAATPAAYSDAFKFLSYSGASRSLSLVSLALCGLAAWRGLPWHSLILLALVPVFYYTFLRMLKQYRKDVVDTVLLLLNGRLSGS
jgi:hypothetical protein